MNKYFKIFALFYQDEETFSGYSDGYGKKHLTNPIMKGVKGQLDWNFNSIEEAELAIYQHGEDCQEYIIQPIYKNER